jgi:uncharacterized protein YbjT (DUF2867 family)
MTQHDTSDVTTSSAPSSEGPLSTDAGTILVTGGTGTLGSAVLPLLRGTGRDVRVLSRQSRAPSGTVSYAVGDLSTGAGVAEALAGVSTVLHLAGTNKGDEEKASNLVRGTKAAGVRPHVVYISVVGADRLPVVSRLDHAMFGYFASKRGAEVVIAESGLPWTTLRATQFHELMLLIGRGMAKLPVIPVASGFRFQPVDSADVAERLVELARGEPAGLVPDIAGPRIYTMKELVRSYLRAVGKHRLTVPVRAPGKAARAYREGANLAPDRAVGRRTWEQFLAAHVAG